MSLEQQRKMQVWGSHHSVPSGCCPPPSYNVKARPYLISLDLVTPWQPGRMRSLNEGVALDVYRASPVLYALAYNYVA